MFWRRFAVLLGTFRAELMKEPVRLSTQSVRQGAVVAVCFAAVAVSMPVLAERGAAQRTESEWAQRAAMFHQDMLDARTARGAAADFKSVARLQVRPTLAGFSARTTAAMPADLENAPAMRLTPLLAERAALAGLRPFQPATLRQSSDMSKAHGCLAEAIYYEARSESFAGQMAVADVVMNRVRSRAYPNTVCEVVLQGSHLSTGCQFTFTCDGSRGVRPRGAAWDRAKLIAAQVLMGFSRPVTQRATHYHTDEVSPVWSASLVETTRIGAHIFYRFPSRSERSAMRAAAAQEEYGVPGGLVITPETEVVTPRRARIITSALTQGEAGSSASLEVDGVLETATS